MEISQLRRRGVIAGEEGRNFRREEEAGADWKRVGQAQDAKGRSSGIMQLAISHRGNKAREASFIKVYSATYLITNNFFSSNIDRFPWGPLDPNLNSFISSA